MRRRGTAASFHHCPVRGRRRGTHAGSGSRRGSARGSGRVLLRTIAPKASSWPIRRANSASGSLTAWRAGSVDGPSRRGGKGPPREGRYEVLSAMFPLSPLAWRICGSHRRAANPHRNFKSENHARIISSPVSFDPAVRMKVGPRAYELRHRDAGRIALVSRVRHVPVDGCTG